MQEVIDHRDAKFFPQFIEVDLIDRVDVVQKAGEASLRLSLPPLYTVGKLVSVAQIEVD